MNLPWQARNQNESGFITTPEHPGARESSGLSVNVYSSRDGVVLIAV